MEGLDWKTVILIASSASAVGGLIGGFIGTLISSHHRTRGARRLQAAELVKKQLDVNRGNNSESEDPAVLLVWFIKAMELAEDRRFWRQVVHGTASAVDAQRTVSRIRAVLDELKLQSAQSSASSKQ